MNKEEAYKEQRRNNILAKIKPFTVSKPNDPAITHALHECYDAGYDQANRETEELRTALERIAYYASIHEDYCQCDMCNIYRIVTPFAEKPGA